MIFYFQYFFTELDFWKFDKYFNINNDILGSNNVQKPQFFDFPKVKQTGNIL